MLGDGVVGKQGIYGMLMNEGDEFSTTRGTSMVLTDNKGFGREGFQFGLLYTR